MTVEIRRRTALPAAVTVLAAVLAAGYLWLYVAHGGEVALLLSVVLAALAGVYGGSWLTARVPLLVADSTGVRVHLGGKWTGLLWDDMKRVEVRPRRAVGDGRVSLEPRDGAVFPAAGRRQRWETRWNRWLYGAELVVPYGLTTVTSAADLPTALRQLADGRTEVVAPEPTAVRSAREVEAVDVAEQGEEVSADGPSTVQDQQASGGSEQPWAAAEDDGTTPDDPTDQDVEGKLPTQRTSGRHVAVVGFWEEEDEGASQSDVTAKPVVAVPLRPLPGGEDAPVARREDVTIAMRREPVEGTLALAEADEARTEELPEIDELRRSPEPADRGVVGALGSGNIALIIDATTDLSARAMRKVRRPGGEPPAHDDGSGRDDEQPSDLRGRDLDIGLELRRARENLGLSVDELADRTRIRPFVIECMEADDFSPCGGDFYARGHLRMLARVLGIAAEPLVETYDQNFATSPVSLREVFDAELATGSTGMVRGGSADANWTGLVAAVVVLLVIWGVARYLVG